MQKYQQQASQLDCGYNKIKVFKKIRFLIVETCSMQKKKKKVKKQVPEWKNDELFRCCQDKTGSTKILRQ